MAAPKRRTSIEWPTEVDDRLRLLVGLAGRSSRLSGVSSANELLAALVCEQPLDPDALARTISRYRRVELREVDRATSAKGGAPKPRRGRPRTRTKPVAGGEDASEL